MLFCLSVYSCYFCYYCFGCVSMLNIHRHTIHIFIFYTNIYKKQSVNIKITLQLTESKRIEIEHINTHNICTVRIACAFALLFSIAVVLFPSGLCMYWRRPRRRYLYITNLVYLIICVRACLIYLFIIFLNTQIPQRIAMRMKETEISSERVNSTRRTSKKNTEVLIFIFGFKTQFHWIE